MVLVPINYRLFKPLNVFTESIVCVYYKFVPPRFVIGSTQKIKTRFDIFILVTVNVKIKIIIADGAAS